jgi:hypothetical protein
MLQKYIFFSIYKKKLFPHPSQALFCTVQPLSGLTPEGTLSKITFLHDLQVFLELFTKGRHPTEEEVKTGHEFILRRSPQKIIFPF